MAPGSNQSILFLHIYFWLQPLLDVINRMRHIWAGRKFRASSYYMVVLLQCRRANPNIKLPDAQGFTNPLAITSVSHSFHKKYNSCEYLKCLLKQWLTSEIILPFPLKQDGVSPVASCCWKGFWITSDCLIPANLGSSASVGGEWREKFPTEFWEFLPFRCSLFSKGVSDLLSKCSGDIWRKMFFPEISPMSQRSINKFKKVGGRREPACWPFKIKEQLHFLIKVILRDCLYSKNMLRAWIVRKCVKIKLGDNK